MTTIIVPNVWATAKTDGAMTSLSLSYGSAAYAYARGFNLSLSKSIKSALMKDPDVTVKNLADLLEMNSSASCIARDTTELWVAEP